MPTSASAPRRRLDRPGRQRGGPRRAVPPGPARQAQRQAAEVGKPGHLLHRPAAHRGQPRARRVHRARRLPHQLADHREPGRPAAPVGLQQLQRHPEVGDLLGRIQELGHRGGRDHGRRRRARHHGELRARPLRVQAQGRDVRAVRRGPDVPAGDRDHPALHHRQGPWPGRQPDGHRHPADRLRAADDGHHPDAVPARHPQGDRGGRGHRRLEPPRVLLPHGHPAVAARRDHRRHPRLHHQLEQLHPAAVHPELAGELHAAARRAAVLLAVLDPTRRGSSRSPRCRCCPR